jgi:tellurite resistance protein
LDVEGTIQFILESQAKAEARLSVIDGRLDSITKLIRQGMRLLVKFQGEAAAFQSETTSKFNTLVDSQMRTDAKLDRVAEAQLRTDAKLEELAEAQKVTELKLQLLFDTLRKNRNGDQH